MTGPIILVIDDDCELREGICLELEDRGFRTFGAAFLKEVPTDCVQEAEFAVVDLRLERTSGIDVTEKLKKLNPEIKILLITGYGSIPTAVEAMKRGAHQYLTKPVTVDQILDVFYDDAEDQEMDRRK